MCFPSPFKKPLSNHKKPCKVFLLYIKVFTLKRTKQGHVNIHHKLFYFMVSVEHPFFWMARSTEQDLRDEIFIHCFTIRFVHSGNRYRVEPEH